MHSSGGEAPEDGYDFAGGVAGEDCVGVLVVGVKLLGRVDDDDPHSCGKLASRLHQLLGAFTKKRRINDYRARPAAGEVVDGVGEGVGQQHLGAFAFE